jgi:glycosyltransferase involved in cell wall biosynthesis
MRILFSSHVFSPSVGGIETVSGLLAREFVKQGHEVRLITETAGGPSLEGFEIHRQPSAAQLLKLVSWCDVCFHNNISLPKAWPLLVVRRPWVVAHHTWIPERGLAARVKRYVLRHATGIAISNAVAAHLTTPSVVIPNPYDDSLFQAAESAERKRDLVFLGRLVSDKGADLVLSAAAALSQRGLTPSVTIVGSGPEAGALRTQADALGIASSVEFAGPVRGPDLVRLLSQHRVLVIPSRWSEPFGVVALEGIAAGCVVVGSDRGGLPDAIGPCGVTFSSGDVDALVAALERLLQDPSYVAVLRKAAAGHLNRHRSNSVAEEYLRVFEEAIESDSSQWGGRWISS